MYLRASPIPSHFPPIITAFYTHPGHRWQLKELPTIVLQKYLLFFSIYPNEYNDATVQPPSLR